MILHEFHVGPTGLNKVLKKILTNLVCTRSVKCFYCHFELIISKVIPYYFGFIITKKMQSIMFTVLIITLCEQYYVSLG